MHNNGSSSTLLVLQGTLPIVYGGARFNIPMNVWMPENYPASPPMCFVSPTADMVIKDRHQHVDMEGKCYHPMLSGWSAQGGSGVSQILQVFGRDPPVYAKPADYKPPQ